MERGAVPALVAEAFGTFLFFSVGAGAVVVAATAEGGGGGLVGVALAHGLVLAVLVSALAAVSGGHFNPAVTFGVWIAGRIQTTLALGYVAAQLVGALAAGLFLRAIFDPSVDPTGLGTPALGPDIGPPTGILVEAVLTLVLLTAVFGTAVDPRAPRLGGFAIGLAVAADILFGGPLTGAAMNPARWFGPAVVAGRLADWYVWWVGPLLGAAIVGLLYRSVFLPAAEPGRDPAAPEG